ncbi:MAG: hypothetical protein LBL55_12010 [Propionibacteriaceae bacterium]|nr:hypothetical protein [Propionibacteriaceae bacterium]
MKAALLPALACLCVSALSACSSAPEPAIVDPVIADPVIDPDLPVVEIDPGLPVVELVGDWPYFDGLDAVIARSDAVVTATFLSSKSTVVYPDTSGTDPETNPQAGVDLSTLSPEQRARFGVPATVSLVRIDSCLRGSLRAGDTISIVQTGGTRDGVRYRDNSTTLLGEAPSPQLVLVLRQNADGTYSTVDPVLGLLAKDGDAVSFFKPNLVDAASLQITSMSQLSAAVEQASVGATAD